MTTTNRLNLALLHHLLDRLFARLFTPGLDNENEEFRMYEILEEREAVPLGWNRKIKVIRISWFGGLVRMS